MGQKDNIPCTLYLDSCYYTENKETIHRLERGWDFPLYPYKPDGELYEFLSYTCDEYLYMDNGDMYYREDKYPIIEADRYGCIKVYVYQRDLEHSYFSLIYRYRSPIIGEYMVSFTHEEFKDIYDEDNIPVYMYLMSMRVSLFDNIRRCYNDITIQCLS